MLKSDVNLPTNQPSRHSHPFAFVRIMHVSATIMPWISVSILQQCSEWFNKSKKVHPQEPTKHWCSPKHEVSNERVKIFSLTLPWLLVNSLAADKFPHISRFSRQVVTLSEVIRYMMSGMLKRCSFTHCYVFYLSTVCSLSFYIKLHNCK